MDELRPRRRRRILFLLLPAIIALVGGAAFSQRSQLQSRYYAYRLERSSTDDRPIWLERLTALGEPAGLRLLKCLRKDDTNLCESARNGLSKLLADWGAKDDRSLRLAEDFFDEQPSFALAGQLTALQLLPELLASENVETSAKARTLVATALKAKAAEQRYLAIGVASRPELNLLPSLVPLLDDPEATIRRAALLVLGPIREGASGVDKPVIGDEALLRWLHDPDPEVRRVCEMSLHSRELGDRDIRLGRMLTNPDPIDRLRLLVELPREEDLDLNKWLKRLSEDGDSAVRAGAARLAAERNLDFAERLEQMSLHDPDGTVRKIAEHYRKLYP